MIFMTVQAPPQPKVNEEKSSFEKIYSFTKNTYLRFVIRKFFFYIIILFVALSLVWLIPRLLPGDPLNALFSSSGTGTGQWQAERKAELRKFYGLDKPLLDQFISFWVNLLHFNLGYSFDQVRITVLDSIMPAFYLTMMLVIPVLIIGFFLGNYIGSKAAVYKGKKSKSIYYLSVTFQSAPYYWTALLAVILLFFFDDQLKADIFPSKWYLLSLDYFFKNPIVFLEHYIIPFTVMLMFSTGGWSTGMRSMMLYELDSPYLLYAKQLGFKKSLIESYARRNAILPQVTGLNLRLNELIGATIIIEYVFNYPGLGRIIVESATSQNYPLIVGSFVIIILVTVIGNFLLDVLYGLIDPRIRTGTKN